jgi:16S rRNA (guanine527-N7)-methyltransferase
MHTMRDPWTAPLATAAAVLGRALHDREISILSAYLDTLSQWNRKINLSGSREPEALAGHVLDCLSLVPHLPGDAKRLVDVGSGAGLPGAVLAAVCPELEVTALEPVHKKHAFLATVRRELGLANLHPLARRVEAHRSASGFALYDVAVSRATFALPDWLEIGGTLVHESGRVLAMEGSEQNVLPAGASRHAYEIPGSDRRRAIIVSGPRG